MIWMNSLILLRYLLLSTFVRTEQAEEDPEPAAAEDIADVAKRRSTFTESEKYNFYHHYTVFDRLKAGLKYTPGPPIFIKPDLFRDGWGW